MLQTIIVLPDGTEVSAGAGKDIAIKSFKQTACVNDGTELSIGSTCANSLEATLYDIGSKLTLTAGDEVTVYRVNGTDKKKVGVFILEKPTRPAANTIKLNGYTRIVKLDKDLTDWIRGLDGWPYTLKAFAKMVCNQCGLTFVEADIPNADFSVNQFVKSGVTGRQLMKWIGEICCRFCRANDDGNIEFGWYKPSGVIIAPSGSRYFFPGALSYETYHVAPIDAVHIRLADSDSGALWPEAEDGANSYVISGNPILLASVTDATQAYLEVIKEELSGVTYIPCKLSMPACLDIDAGNTVDIVDKNGARITSYVMTKITTGQKDTIECTGSARRDSPAAVNNRSQSAVAAEAAKDAFSGLTQQQIFNKLTNNGKVQGIYIQDNAWYINGEYANLRNLKAGSITAGKLSSTNGKTYFDLDEGKIVTNDITATGGTIGGWKVDNNSLYSGNSFASAECFLCTGSKTEFEIGTSGLISGWMLKAGSNFGVTKAGAAYMTDAYIEGIVKATSGSFSGTIDAKDGSIGGWEIGTYTTDDESVDYYSGPALIAELAGTVVSKVILTPIGVYYSYYNGTQMVTVFASWATIVSTTASAAAAALVAEET